jgi:Protein of unknown function (DUF2934)
MATSKKPSRGISKRTTKSVSTKANVSAVSSSGTAAAVAPAYGSDAIRTRAYALFEQRGGAHGQDLEDWFRAEAELAHNGVKQSA